LSRQTEAGQREQEQDSIIPPLYQNWRPDTCGSTTLLLRYVRPAIFLPAGFIRSCKPAGSYAVADEAQLFAGES